MSRRRRRLRPFVRQQNPTQARDSARAWVRTLAAVTVAGATAAAFSAPAHAAPADSSCLRAGLEALRGLDALDAVARDGLPVSYAVDELGVQPREGTDVSSLPSVLPLRVVLRDHLAGDDSLLVYPWCS